MEYRQMSISSEMKDLFRGMLRRGGAPDFRSMEKKDKK